MPGFEEFGPPGEALRGYYGPADDRLHGFYVPVLSRASHYDRVSGYFTSAGLAAAARGLARFLPGGGTMRLIVGAQLSCADVIAMTNPGEVDAALAQALIGSGALDEDLIDVIHKRYREVLAWMFAAGRCEIKVGLRRGPDGMPVPAEEDPNYFHHKLGVFTDAVGAQIVFDGSGNETWKGWLGNSESFSVVASWWGADWWDAQGAPVAADIDRMWQGDAGPEWMIVDLPTAVQDHLLKLAPSEMPPPVDPADSLPGSEVAPIVRAEEATSGQLADLLGRLTDSPGSGVMTAGVEPLPHQVSVLQRALQRWPRGHLFADEVGLGKTIEVGLTIREAIVRGVAERVLLLVPAAVIQQWQDELAEKLALWVPRWAGPNSGWIWPDGAITPAQRGDPWSTSLPIVLVSSQLARMRRHRNELLGAPQWDIVAVDEAHHARRQGGEADGRPNQLLSLLHEMRRETSWGTLLLATATPMQMHPHELWDLVDLLGLPERWAEEYAYERYYGEIARQDFKSRQWPFLSTMVLSHREDPNGGGIDTALDAEIKAGTGRERLTITGFGKRGKVQQGWGAKISEDNRHWVDAWLLTNNPIRDRLFRNTRNTLRAYRDRGLLTETIPDRDVEDKFLAMSPEERAVYRRIRDYIRGHYNAAQRARGSRRGLGFIMTVYRRRLTSSFEAIRRSLQRRLEVLEGQRDVDGLLADDDLTLFDDQPDIDWAAAAKAYRDGEIQELRAFIAEIEALPDEETKLKCLMGLIQEAFSAGHRTVLVFSQYADTVDLLRKRLNLRWPGQVLAYTGTGGRLWDPPSRQWEDVGKTEAKTLFRQGDRVKILVGTDTLAEGLNLQTCGRLINYDMPWNFTRVEQRIGRLDRIGGKAQVEVTNLFYERTVEANIYRTLVEDHDGFSFIVGAAQPVLGEIANAIQEAAFSDDEDDASGSSAAPQMLFAATGQLIQGIRKRIEEAEHAVVRLQDMDDRANASVAEAFPEAVTLAEVEMTMLRDERVREQLTPHPDTNRVWRMVDRNEAEKAVTFDRRALSEHSPSVRLLAPGDPLFDLVVRRASS